MEERITEITPPNLPFHLDDKIFNYVDLDGNPTGEKYSYNDRIQFFKNISGVSEELLGNC